MEVILLERVRNLGSLGEKVTVRGGYARNFLIPKGIAVRATDRNLQEFETRRAELEQKAADTLAKAQARATKLEVLEVTIAAHSGDEGKLFGSVGTRDIADAISAKGIEVCKSEVRLPLGALRYIGEYQIDIQLHSDVTQPVKIVVVAEQ